MNKYQVTITGTNGETQFSIIKAQSILEAWEVIHQLTSQIVYVGVPLTLTIQEI